VYGLVKSSFWPTQNQVSRPELLTTASQIFGFWFFTALWYAFGQLGSDPIRSTDPEIVT
jgi:hypothetical protein